MRSRRVISPVSLRDHYVELGNYTAKFLIDSAVSADVKHVDVVMRNSDGKPMDIEFRRWGTKLTLSFAINDSVPDGIVIIDILMRGSKEIKERFDFWVIK